MLEQISIFAENKKGAMKNITKALSDNGINIFNVVTNDSAEYGIVRILVDDTKKAMVFLSNAGYLCNVSKVIGVVIPDSVGSLSSLLESIYDANINIDYIYVSYNRESAKPVAIIKAAGYTEVEACLKSKGYTIL